jgi:acetyltransferase
MFVTSDVEFMRPFSSVLYSESIPTFASADGVANAFRAWKQREDLVFSRLGKEETQQESVELSNVQLTQCHDYLSCKGSGWVLEHEARTLLDILGVRQPKAELVSTGSSLKDVVEAAEMIGFPVALKRVDHVHKAKAGGVALDLHNPAQVQAAFQKMCLSMDSSSITTAPMLVCEYISTAFLREFLIGIVHDETFGPAICFGSGGSFVEAMDDVAFALPPQTRLDTLELVRRSKLAMSKPQMDLSVIADAVERIAALAKAFPNIAELDVNPVMVGLYDQGETRLQAADIKFRLDG